MASSRVLVAVGLAMAMLAACSPYKPTPPKADDGLLLSVPDDPAIATAKAEALKTLPVFWRKWEAKAPGDSDFALKVGFKVKDGGTEHIWVRPLRREGDELDVRLANEPVYFKGLKLGSEVRVLADDVSDWAYAHDGKLYGHYSTRALMAQATPAERAELARLLAPTPLEPADR